MKKIFYLLVFYCLVVCATAKAQCNILPNALTGYPDTLASFGDSVNSVAYSDYYGFYYCTINNHSVNGLNYIGVFDNSGTSITYVTATNCYDFIWWNNSTHQLEGKVYTTNQVQQITLNATTGIPTGNTVNISNLASNISGGCFDPVNNYILGYSNGAIYKFSRSTGALINTLTLTGLPANLGNLNNNSCFYTGCPGKEYGVYDQASKRVYFIDASTGAYVGASQLPNLAPSPAVGDVSYTNQMLWLGAPSNYPFVDSSKCLGYYILADTPTIMTSTFSMYVHPECNTLHFNFNTTPFFLNSRVKTFFGDGDTVSSAILTGGVAAYEHVYNAPGTYQIKHLYYSGGYYNGSVPVDSSSYSYEQTFCNTIILKFYLDVDGDCTMDNSDFFITQPLTIEVDSNGISIDTVSATSGLYYTAYGQPGSVYKFTVINSGFLLAGCTNGIVYDTLISNNDNVVNYLPLTFSNQGGGFDLGTTALFQAGPHHGRVHIFVDNSSSIGVNGILSTIYPSLYTYLSSAPLLNGSADTSAAWFCNNLSISGIGEWLYLDLWKSGIDEIPLGTIIHSTYNVSPTLGDVNTSNNTNVRDDTVKSSDDPNEMWVSPVGYIASGTQLKYTILFENVGNAPAHNIYVMDTLSDDVDAQSLRIVTTSAVMNIALLQSNGHNIVKFDFPNINLLDSSHHGQCDGLVVFNVNAKHGLPMGTTIFNHAGVFFDDNPVVTTDTVENIIGMQEGVKQVTKADDVKLYPNPANDAITITTGNTVYQTLMVTNNVGEVVMQQDVNATRMNVDVKRLAPAVYFVELKGSGGSRKMKFVKL